jgi:hypothetical protein
MVDELEREANSKREHLKTYEEELNLLKNTDNHEYSITDKARCDRYSVLAENSEEFKRIETHFHLTLSHKIIRIEKSNNPVLERKFAERSRQLSCQNIKYLFHGSNDKAYSNILETGFDTSYASPTGLLGKGIYFAEESGYSHGYGNITQTNLGKINHILYCKVNVGKTCKGTTGLTDNPPGFDGVHSDHKTVALFHDFQGIPEYIIYYLCDT